ncbi:Os01g0333432 [Oryza sativa Japonica Group]|uniref:Os01g0333432 protein n=1 Tax=Oryza sativa subsp. japonica TaxID=39947 RepID=A0A0N7KCW2_ORYSJ|nr:Os01g0333432 [Oryza sativa Japonica Group]
MGLCDGAGLGCSAMRRQEAGRGHAVVSGRLPLLSMANATCLLSLPPQRYGNMEKTKLFEACTEPEAPLVSKRGGQVIHIYFNGQR